MVRLLLVVSRLLIVKWSYAELIGSKRTFETLHDYKMKQHFKKTNLLEYDFQYTYSLTLIQSDSITFL